LWPVGIISSAFYIYVFYDAKIYADMNLQVYYLVVSVYGWYYWVTGAKQKHRAELPISKTSGIQYLYLAIITLILYFIIYYILVRFTDSPVPVLDALTTAISITGTWMLARKLLENWILWVFVDIIYCGLYYYKELYLTIALYFCMAILAIIGYLEWKKKFNLQNGN
jgi:nicotinamide mononucleotide transporter